MAQFAAMSQMFQQMGKSKTKDGAKATTGMMQAMQQFDPIKKMGENFMKLVEAAIPLGDAINEALTEVADVFTGSFMEGFAPAMEPIIETLTKPEVLEAITQIGKGFADMFIAMAPLVETLLPAFIWIIKAIGNVIILVVNIVITVINIFSLVIDAIAKVFGIQTGFHPIPYYNYIAAGGADFLTTGPTSILAGEAGQEHVQITPVGEESGGSIIVNINAGTIITERELENTIRRTVDDVMRDNHLLK